MGVFSVEVFTNRDLFYSELCTFCGRYVQKKVGFIAGKSSRQRLTVFHRLCVCM